MEGEEKVEEVVVKILEGAEKVEEAREVVVTRLEGEEMVEVVSKLVEEGELVMVKEVVVMVVEGSKQVVKAPELEQVVKVLEPEVKGEEEEEAEAWG